MCLRYEQLRKTLADLIETAERNRDAVKDNDKAWNYWEQKVTHLYNALCEINLAQYTKKPEEE